LKKERGKVQKGKVDFFFGRGGGEKPKMTQKGGKECGVQGWSRNRGEKGENNLETTNAKGGVFRGKRGGKRRGGKTNGT